METTYLKLFKNHSEYNVEDTPNVSYCEAENEVHYNPVETKLVCKYNITDISSPTVLRTEYEQNVFKSMEIDGVLLDSLVTSYQFNTTGEHIVKYELYNETKVGNETALFDYITTLSSVSIPNSVTTIGGWAFLNCIGFTNITIPNNITTIGDNAFGSCTGLTNITIPNSVVTIDDNAFQSCNSLTSVTIGNNVTAIGNYVFDDCGGLTSVTIEATTPPTLGSDAFYDNASGRKIYVPSESVNTYKAASGWLSYSADIEAIQ